MRGIRALRVGELIQQELSYLLAREMKDPRLELVAVTRVELSEDIKYGKVYISAYGGGDQKEVMEALEGAAGFIKGQLGKRLKIKQVPQLSFRFDESAEHGVRISKLLRDLGVSGQNRAEGTQDR